MNPMEIIKGFMAKGGNPEQVLMRAMAGNKSVPMISNLMNMAKNGNKQGIENFARNYFNERGRDFDKEFADFMQNLKR